MHAKMAALPRNAKGALLALLDGALVVLSYWAAVSLRMSDPWAAPVLGAGLPALGVALSAGVALWWALRIHSIKVTTSGGRSLLRVFGWCACVSLVTTLANAALGLGLPRTVPLVMGALMLGGAPAARLLAQSLLLAGHARASVPVAVYGAGAAGVQMVSALQASHEYRPVALVDDNPALHGVVVSGLEVVGADALGALVARGAVRRVIVAIPSLGAAARRRLIGRLDALGVPVEALPSYVEMVGAGTLREALRPVALEDLLGREAVALDMPAIRAAYRGRSVLVSGAGGSIGSELCRQAITAGAARLVLLERSEYALYAIERELAPLADGAGCALVPALGDVADGRACEGLLRAHGVETVLHAAAYKHVPIVEGNEAAGVRNNALGTRAFAEAAARAGVGRFVLVSTDKAVRPPNVMGATKRMAEIAVQDLQRRTRGTVFSMVRFGNVLGSSGSVIPLFRAQIEKGGPVTLTDPGVTRYFMTIPEAARLVMLAGTFAEGGEVFVLDMGAPVRIHDLARQMIELSGLTVRDADRPDGDIAIEVTGLRPGEKLHEELLIDADTLATPHPKILRAQEGCPPGPVVAGVLSRLEGAAGRGDAAALRAELSRLVDGFAAPRRAAA
ncbi:FlaA1/EpsC-like NDP-sugar epimerase [Hasllibacter halocynthiae]|uniref:FlaA1/EpsC-like NDP-sugar epimerase n=1 Tax=Hasllibacter halocynthiae TaxID=595589 RepID=A0A2T0X2N2_9RHOB|nr:nucleoside-diphosphate sugar epimerase/dehydratase [Hasllibacter halocynthiae]PRY93155.1 FlaA1/EpsC-like NDP-sugar epimerase [Hasllibacter halocynthiae]